MPSSFLPAYWQRLLVNYRKIMSEFLNKLPSPVGRSTVYDDDLLVGYSRPTNDLTQSLTVLAWFLTARLWKLEGRYCQSQSALEASEVLKVKNS